MSLEDCMCEILFMRVMTNFNNSHLHNIKVSYLTGLLNMSSFIKDDTEWFKWSRSTESTAHSSFNILWTCYCVV